MPFPEEITGWQCATISFTCCNSLPSRDLISYDSSKTDEDYLEELLQPDLKTQFKKLNRIYDFVWYGHFDTGPDDFEKIRKDFQKMQFLISPSHEQNL